MPACVGREPTSPIFSAPPTGDACSRRLLRRRLRCLPSGGGVYVTVTRGTDLVESEGCRRYGRNEPPERDGVTAEEGVQRTHGSDRMTVSSPRPETDGAFLHTNRLRAMALFSRAVSILFIAAGLVSGCASPSAQPEAEGGIVTDSSYLTSDQWNDGRAEVAFYDVHRTRDQYGRDNEQRFVAGTYLVKHNFSPTEMTKMTDGSGTPSFKYAFFYELESGSYQYKRNWVVNARQQDLRPFKQSFTSFDWCSNLYREIAFPPRGEIEVRKRSDDYGNRRTSFASQDGSYPPAQLPLVIRGLDFRASDTLSFDVVRADSARHVSVQAVFTGRDSVRTPAGAFQTERIALTYDEPVPSLIGETSTTRELYWRGTGPWRLLVQMEAENGRYRMTLREHLRSAYWEENLWSQVEQVEARP